MPGFYSDGDYDLAGFCVGIVDEAKVITGNAIAPGIVLPCRRVAPIQTASPDSAHPSRRAGCLTRPRSASPSSWNRRLST